MTMLPNKPIPASSLDYGRIGAHWRGRPMNAVRLHTILVNLGKGRP